MLSWRGASLSIGTTLHLPFIKKSGEFAYQLSDYHLLKDSAHGDRCYWVTSYIFPLVDTEPMQMFRKIIAL